MTTYRPAIGFALFVALIATSVVALRSAHRDDLAIEFQQGPPLVADVDTRMKGQITPTDLSTRVRTSFDGRQISSSVLGSSEFSIDLPPSGPGIHFVDWTVEYGQRWKRQVTASVLSGPFSERASTSCNAQVTISQSFLDRLATALQPQVLLRVNEALQAATRNYGVSLPEASTANVQVILEARGVRIELEVPDFFSISATIALRRRSGGDGFEPYRVGDPIVRADRAFEERLRKIGGNKGALQVGGLAFLACAVFTGGTCLIAAGAGAVVGNAAGESTAQSALDSELGSAIDTKLMPQLAKLAEPDAFTIAKGSSGPKLSVRVCSEAQIVAGQYVSFRLNARLDNVASAIPGLTGPIAFGTLAPDPSANGDVVIDASPDLLNALMYALWQRHVLRDFLMAADTLANINERLADFSFRVKGIDPVLPPVLSPVGSTFGLRVGELRVQLLPTGGGAMSEAVLAGTATLDFDKPNAREVEAHLTDLFLSCRQETALGERRFPCFSDLIALASEQLRGPDGALVFDVGKKLNAVIRSLRPAEKAGIEVGVQSVVLSRTSGSSAWLRLSADVSVTSR